MVPLKAVTAVTVVQWDAAPTNRQLTVCTASDKLNKDNPHSTTATREIHLRLYAAPKPNCPGNWLAIARSIQLAKQYKR